MEPLIRISGPAACLPQPNIDTDVIMPKQFLKGVDRRGLDRGVFFDLRFDAQGQPRPDFILNRPGWRNARFLVVGPNFGCGSSREHAVWGLAQLGIRALIGTSFAGIFNDNCQRNGILTVTLDAGLVADLMAVAGQAGANGLTVDLPAQTIIVNADGRIIPFAIDPVRKDALVQGLDGVSATLARHAGAIRVFEAGHRQANPWFF
ncbi:MAG: 3-isopropylmalate dehydratase small subunit [Azospirillaceae bacterium]|nr:3-isopropylmalate dehydratase small subunit [Azospirillaceae bacterium]